ncbi:hypothetical protein SAMN04488079_101250 [Methylophaga sulfidovorans]|uniref:Uncharacterized protein n=1 Tax=Methylophaga sulfidovorans TaxID=45496 RepID=A0A1I3UAJ0_9GAMM|nr:hypothetical protein SAMN04488079_101250 [Methylophaga sulfidovorans]
MNFINLITASTAQITVQYEFDIAFLSENISRLALTIAYLIVLGMGIHTL